MPREAAEDVARLTSLLDAVLRRSSDAVVVLGADGLIQGWNPAAARTFGAAEDAVLGQPFARFVGAERDREWQALLEGALGGFSATLPAVVLHRIDGLAVHTSVAATPTRDASGAAGVCLVIQDHTERVLAQETLALGEERVRRGEALAGVGSFVLDGADRSMQWSEGMYRIFGTSPGVFDGTRQAHLAMVHEDDRASVAMALDDSLVAGQSTELDFRAAVGDRMVWVFLAAEPVMDDAGRVTGVRGVCQDISARKEAEQSVLDALALAQKANDELRALDALKDEFLATVSHELRTPLTAIIGFASVLMRTEPELVTYVDPIARGGADMARMIEKLLDYSRLYAGHVAFQPKAVDLGPEVDRCFAVFAADARDQQLICEVPPGLRVVTDPSALGRILDNLIGNAVRYAEEGSVIHVRAWAEPDGATVLAVADDGPGIPAVHQGRLFERFYQVPGATGSRRGTGIGLAVVREYVVQQGGTVWCESAEGEGAAFFVRLDPAADDDDR